MTSESYDLGKFATFDTKKEIILPNYQIFIEYLKDEFGIISWMDTLYIYADGVYRENENQIECECKEILNHHVSKYHTETQKITPFIDEIIRLLKIDSPESEYPFNKVKGIIPVKNGAVKIDYTTGEKTLLDHDSKYRFTYKLPINYNPDAPIEPFLKILSQWVEENDLIVLLQYPAQCLLAVQGYRFKKAYIFEGERNAGKSTYCDLILLFFGPENVSDVSLQGLIKDQFAWGDLEHKLANFHDELSNFPIACTGPFKDLTGKETHRINRKHKPAYDAPITAVNAFSCNEPPKIKDIDDDAFWGRFEYVIFPYQFPIDPTFEECNFTETNLSGFLNLIIDTMLKISRDGMRLPRNSTPDDVKGKWLPASDSVERFYINHIQSGEGEFYISKEEVYQAYVRDCAKNSEKPEPVRTLKNMFQDKGHFEKQPRTSKNRKRVFMGIRWRDDSPYRNGVESSQQSIPFGTDGTG